MKLSAQIRAGKAAQNQRWTAARGGRNQTSMRFARDYVAGLRAVPFTQDPKPNRKSRIEALDALKKYEKSKKRA
jgi:hypothetical protein